MTDRDSISGLRAGRLAKGWSQIDAARELVTLARSRGLPVAAAPSLKTLLSRWENGHVVPDPQYRALLAELYGRTVTELGLEDPGRRDEAEGRLTAALAAAAAVDGAGLELWREQVELARRLDDELGAAGAGELTRSLADRLAETLVHTVPHATRVGLAGLLTEAATLAGTQCLDRSDHDQAWRRFDQARAAAREAESPTAGSAALAGQAEILVDLGAQVAAVQLLEQARPLPDAGAQARLDAALAIARAVAGDQQASRQALAAAERRLRPRADLTARGDGPPVELADMHRWRGRVMVELDDGTAEESLRRALAAEPRSTRHRAAVHADLALTLRTRRPKDAEQHAGTARQLAAGIGSERIPARLAALGSGR